MLYRFRFRYRPTQFSISVALRIQHNLILHGANVTFVLKILTLLRSDRKKSLLMFVCTTKKYATLCQKSFKSEKSRHPEDSKLVRQDHTIQKMLPGNMIE